MFKDWIKYTANFRIFHNAVFCVLVNYIYCTF